ncbi:copper resistance CopC/CopD family protein [Paenisporosarcina sp.]|uniref:copper resistance CopC/CopD family protein n=1 Tax=Paenisporosarcina sp. TaxID=1932001 RepID=UPI003C75BDDE
MKNIIMILCMALSIFTFSTTVGAHADLASSSPANGAILDTAPTEVVLTFTTPIDNQVFEIDALNVEMVSVANGEPSLNSSRNELTISLTDQISGLITIPYSVISKDGHPIEGSISFTVKEKEVPPISSNESAVISPVTKDSAEEEKTKTVEQTTMTKSSPSMDEAESEQTATPLTSIIKSLYLLSLLLLTGSLLWRFQGHKVPFLAKMQLLHLALLALFTWSQARNFTQVFEGISWQDLFLRTEVGQFWTAALVITVLGLYILGRNRYVDVAWVAGILIAKSLNSHAIATAVPVVTVGLNFIHLLLSALWIAGLFYILTLWKKGSAEAFVPTFSKMALVSIISLTVTGSIYAWLLAPNLSSLWTTTWGYWLFAKIVAVIGVFVLGAFIRRHMKKTGSLSERRYLYFDGVLALTILGIVGVLTQLSSSL